MEMANDRDEAPRKKTQHRHSKGGGGVRVNENGVMGGYANTNFFIFFLFLGRCRCNVPFHLQQSLRCIFGRWIGWWDVGCRCGVASGLRAAMGLGMGCMAKGGTAIKEGEVHDMNK